MSSTTDFSLILTKIGKVHNTSSCITEDIIMRCSGTINQMLLDRGFDEITGCSTFNQITDCMQNCQIIFQGIDSDSGAIIDVFFHNEERVGVKQMRNWCEESIANVIIIVSLDGPTSFTRKETDNYDRQVQFFTFKELCVNITKHLLVPKHELMNEEEKAKLQFLKNPNDLPKLYSNDKVSQYYNFKVGDVIRVTRTIAYSEPVVYYRLVTQPAL